jgi:hypothetical protein
MSNTGNSIKDEAIREIAVGSLSTSYQPLGAVFTRDCFRIWMTNATNGDIYLLTDGVTDMKKLPANSGRANDDKTNDMFRKKGTQWYIRIAAVPAIPTGWAAVEAEYV